MVRVRVKVRVTVGVRLTSGEVATICTSPALPRGAKAIASNPRLVAAASTIGPGDETPGGG